MIILGPLFQNATAEELELAGYKVFKLDIYGTKEELIAQLKQLAHDYKMVNALRDFLYELN